MTTDGEAWDAEAQLGLANDYLTMSEEAAYREPQRVVDSTTRYLDQLEDERPRVIVIVSTTQGYWLNHTGGTPNTVLGDLTRFAHQMMRADDEDD